MRLSIRLKSVEDALPDPNNAAAVRAATTSLIAATGDENIDLHSILVMQRGEMLAEHYLEPFGPDIPHRMYSVTKSFTSSAIGLAVGEGRMTVDDRIVDIFPELVPHDVDPNTAGLRVRDLLTMTAGHVNYRGTAHRPSVTVARFIAEAAGVAPGSRFDYSNPSSYMLGAIVERVTGMAMPDYLKPRLLDPLRIELRHWVKSDEGVTNGGWGLHLTTRELSRFGQMLLQNGQWEGKQLLPESWVAEATGKRTPSWGNAGMGDWVEGYGYQYWRGRHNSVRADGLLGQFCILLRDHDALVVTTAGTMSTQRLLDLVWEKLVPALAGGGSPGNESGFPVLATAAATSPRAAELNGRRFALGEPFLPPTRTFGNQLTLDAIACEPGPDDAALLLTDSLATYRLPIGINRWASGASAVATGYPEPYRAFGRWVSGTRFEVELVLVEAGARMTLAFDLEPLRLRLTLPANPGLDRRVIVGRAFP
jgi:CubicO group peptidase (beta-lactamase class C family)